MRVLSTPAALVRLSAPLLLAAGAAGASQVDIQGPPGSIGFGSSVTVLPNGNIVVTDPYAGVGEQGAVHLYGPDGTLISTLTGSSPQDHIGAQGPSGGGGVTVLSSGNFVISSPAWDNGGASDAGAVTWVDGTTGLSGSISAANSLVGSASGDQVGTHVVALGNGNYVVGSPYWSNGAAPQVGAITWGNGATGIAGAVGAANSLIGPEDYDAVGINGVLPLVNGNYVVGSQSWGLGLGAVTWGDGSIATTGVVSIANSLIGATGGESLHLAYALANGNYVVTSSSWNNGEVDAAGAAAWCNGATGTAGVISATNALVGTHPGDAVGGGGVTALTNGNYVVRSPQWGDGVNTKLGAATWGDGATGLTGPVSAANSLIGTTALDGVSGTVTALSNGNYVVVSRTWQNGAIFHAGAVTWGNGTTGTTGAVSTANSLVGTHASDNVGLSGVVALGNGNYVVASPAWNDSVGAVTWLEGSSASSGVVSGANSLIGATPGDAIGNNGLVTPLSDNNYVVSSYYWNDGPATHLGAVTWGNGSTGTTGVVSAANSLVGTSTDDQVGLAGVAALPNGRYVIASPQWNVGPAQDVGAVTWRAGGGPEAGTISPSNSLVGSAQADRIGNAGVSALADGDYVVDSTYWSSSGVFVAGAVSLGNGNRASVGPLNRNNSVFGTKSYSGASQDFAYDAARKQLVVGQPASNAVTLFVLPLFADDFE
jgi:hypothetical protein